MNKFEQLVRQFTENELIMFVGDNLVPVLKAFDDKINFGKNELLNILFALDIELLLQKKDFRACVLNQMTADEIYSFRIYLPINKSKETNIEKLIENIVLRPWKKGDLLTEYWYRILGIERKNEIEETLVVQNNILSTESNFYELLDYQYMIKQKTLTLLRRKDIPRALIHMPTGTGKTKTTMHTIIQHFIHEIKREGIIIWMAHTNELIEQAISTFETTWRHIGKGDIKVSRLYDKFDLSEDEIDDGMIFCGYQKLISIKKSKPDVFHKLCERCRLLVVDEAHKSVANKTFEVIKSLLIQKDGMLTRGLIGLTATPGRSMNDSDENRKLVSFYENKMINIDLKVLNEINKSVFQNHEEEVAQDVVEYLQDRKILSKVIRVDLNYEGGISNDILKEIGKKTSESADFTNKFINKVGTVVNRNIAIIDKLCELNSGGFPTIVFACSVEHGKLISTVLSMKGIKNRCVFGESTPIDRKRSIEEFKDKNNDMNILINYEVLTTGFDATNIRCVFITRPTKSIVLYSQILGRGLRGPLMGGNSECILVDLKDNLDQYTSESMAFKFFNNYWGK